MNKKLIINNMYGIIKEENKRQLRSGKVVIVTSTEVYFYTKKCIRFWLKILWLKLLGVEYEVIEE